MRCSYQAVREDIEQAALLLWRPAGPMGRLIARVTGSPYCHASRAVWVHVHGSKADDLLCVDTLQFHGGAAVPLSRVASKYPGLVDVYGWAGPRSNRVSAAEMALRRIPGVRYGWRNLWRIGLAMVPGARWVWEPARDDQWTSPWLPVCSAAFALCDRLGGGVDPVPGVADAFVTPSHLANSRCYRYQFTLG